MTQEQAQRDISIIKEMIEKTKKETAESGHLFIFMGLAAALFVFIVSMLEIYRLSKFVIPIMIVLTILNGIIGFLIVNKSTKTEKVQSYPKTIVLSVWMICGLTLVLMTFLFPFLGVYSFGALGTLAALILGIAVFMTGVVYEMKFILWCSSAWWLGAILISVVNSEYRFVILIASIFIGWILPGLILNRQYKQRRR